MTTTYGTPLFLRQFGWFVSLSSDGGTALIGAPGYEGKEGIPSGSTYIFSSGSTDNTDSSKQQPPSRYVSPHSF